MLLVALRGRMARAASALSPRGSAAGPPSAWPCRGPGAVVCGTTAERNKHGRLYSGRGLQALLAPKCTFFTCKAISSCFVTLRAVMWGLGLPWCWL